MYIDYYNSIKSIIDCHLEAIKTIDWFNNQYERYEDLKAVAFPALYVEFEDDIDWETLGNGEQQAETQIVFHLVAFDIGDSPASILLQAKELHKILHGKLLSDEELQLSTELVRTKSRLNTEFDQLKVVKLTYDTTLFDYSTVKATKTVEVSLGINATNN